MPALPTVANTVKIEVHQSLGFDINVVNVLHATYAVAAPLTQAQVDAIATEVQSAWATNISPLQVAATLLYEVKVTDLHTLTGNQGINLTNQAGTGVGTATAAGLCLVTQERTAIRSRSTRGRIYLSGMAEGNQATPQTWVNGLVTAANAAWAAFDAQLLAAATPVGIAVVSYYGPPTVKAGSLGPGVPRRNHSTLRGAGLATRVTHYVTDNGFGFQRRRQ